MDLSRYAMGLSASSGKLFSSQTSLLTPGTSGETMYYLRFASPKTGITTQDRLDKIKEELDQLGYTAEKKGQSDWPMAVRNLFL
ncbi:hypothetical protein [Secundilactobacillus kimchicus]|uniref:hypothetical protein n=1 Tax=Secundilactobacillus kimchicus TaxID=528209 RepID=UPI0006D0BD8C|nr:hypothetical protein [Secundilactobacillus kimchicus]